MSSMLGFSHILAQKSGADDWIRYLFFAIIAVIWLFSAIASAVSKKQEQERRKKVREQIEHAPESASPAAAQRPVKRAAEISMRLPPPLQPRPPARPIQRAAQPKQRRAAAKPSPLPASVSATAESFAPRQPIASKSISPTVGPQPHIATAASIARWLSPATLHQQFILTEVLQPPLALREHRF